MMDEYWKSDSFILLEKSQNKVRKGAAEVMEVRGLAKGNPLKRNVPRRQGRTCTPNVLERMRQAAKRDRKQRFTALFHHVYGVELLGYAYFCLNHNAAPGIDGETWRRYGENLGKNLQDFSERLRRGAYRADLVHRVYIPKTDGRKRPIGILGLTYFCTNNRKGNFMVGRKTEKERFRRSAQNLRSLMREIRHYPMKEQSEKINQVLRAHYAYYGLGGNIKSLFRIYRFTERYWRRMLSSRSRKSYVSWERFQFLKSIFPLLRPKIFIPYAKMESLTVL